MTNIHRIEVSTPFETGDTNAYLIDTEEPIIVDPGPGIEETLADLERGVNAHGYNLEDIDHIFITHPHLDHFGLAHRLKRMTGAEVHAHTNAVPKLTAPVEYATKEREYIRKFLSSAGMPDTKAEIATALPVQYEQIVNPVDITNQISDNDLIDVGTEFLGISTPGHSPGSVCFYHHSQEAMFTGDHLLPKSTANPLLSIDPTEPSTRVQSLPLFIQSLEKIRQHKVGIAYGGHGDPIGNFNERISETISHHNERKRHILEIIEAEDQLTAYDIMEVLFPDLDGVELLFGMSEVIGHIDLLIDENKIREKQSESVYHYEVVS